MRRWLLSSVLIGAALLGGFFVSQAKATTILVTNLSQTVPQADIDAALPAFQIAVSRDFASVWGTDATLTTDPTVPYQMEVWVEDFSDQPGALGYHDVIHGHPVSRVFAAEGAIWNESWQLTFTHELFEMLADPWINRFAVYKKKTWLVEVGDPVESGFYAYTINGVVISDFITPAWYGQGWASSPLKTPVDFTHGLKRPGTVGRHGYASYRVDNKWGQVFG